MKQSVQVSLENLKTTYIDSLVLHSPMRTDDDTMRVWRVLETFVDDGTIHQLGMYSRNILFLALYHYYLFVL